MGPARPGQWQASKAWEETCTIPDGISWLGFGAGFLSFSVIIIRAFISTGFLSVRSVEREGEVRKLWVYVTSAVLKHH